LHQHLLLGLVVNLYVDIEKIKPAEPLKEFTLILRQDFHSIFHEQYFTAIILVSSFSFVLVSDNVFPHDMHLFQYCW
jgi:hypothetical protein